MVFLLSIIASVAGLGALVCFVMTVIEMFQEDETTWAIACVVLAFFGGVGALIAFARGWLNGGGTVMLTWTGCLFVGIFAKFLMILIT